MNAITQKISQHRTALMGFAIAWIMLFHAQVQLPPLLAQLKQFGFAGVDLFFFLSGFGLMMGWLTKPDTERNTRTFLQRRLIRIIPAYWIVGSTFWLLAFLFDDETIIDLLALLLGLDYFIMAQLRYWFIPAIIVCYLAFPFYVYFYLKANHKALWTLSAIVLSVLSSLIFINTHTPHLLFFIERIPNFLLGIYVAERFLNQQPDHLPQNTYLNTAIVVLMLAVLYCIFKTFPVAVRWQYGLSMYPLIIMTYPLICLLVTAWDHWHSAGLEHFFYQHLNRFFSFLGHHSLELYLVHILIFKALEKLQEKIAFPETIKLLNVAKIPEYLIYTIISIIGAVILKKVVAFLLIKTRTVFA